MDEYNLGLLDFANEWSKLIRCKFYHNIKQICMLFSVFLLCTTGLAWTTSLGQYGHLEFWVRTSYRSCHVHGWKFKNFEFYVIIGIKVHAFKSAMLRTWHIIYPITRLSRPIRYFNCSIESYKQLYNITNSYPIISCWLWILSILISTPCIYFTRVVPVGPNGDQLCKQTWLTYNREECLVLLDTNVANNITCVKSQLICGVRNTTKLQATYWLIVKETKYLKII